MLALEYAAIFVVILLCLLPAFMAFTIDKYKTPLRRAFLTGLVVVSFGIIWLDVVSRYAS
jgi:hypothetical protein